MTLFELMAKISLDTSEYDSGLSSASGKLQTFGGSIKNGFGKIIKAGGVALAGASSAVVAFGASSVKTGMDFDKSMSQVAATMGKTTDEIQDLRDFAQEMGSTTSFSAKQAADALNYMALAGYDSEKSMKMLPNVLNLAAAGGMDLATASDMVTDASSALGLSMGETEAMVDQMARASSKSNTSVEQLGQAMLTVGGTAKSLKGGTTELSTALGILADNGTKGAEGGTALRNILTSIQGSKFEKTFGEMGISAYDAQGNLRSLKDVFMDMNTAMDGMTTEEKTNLINNTFNARDLKNVNALLGTNAERWDELSASIGDSAGAAKEMADTQLDNLAGDITLFKSALEGAQIAISDNLSPSLREFVKTGSDGLSKFTGLLKDGDFSGAMQPLGDTIGQLATKVISKVPAMVSAGVELLKGIGQGIASQAPTLFDSLMTGIVGLTKQLGSMFDGVDFGAVITGFVSNFINAIESIGATFIPIGISMIQNIGQGLVQGIPDLLTNVLPMIEQFTEFIRANAGLLIDAGLAFIKNLAQGLINSIPVLISYVPQIVTNIAGIINDNAPKVLAAGINIIKNLVTGIVQSIPVIVANLPQIVAAIWNVFTAVNWLNLGSSIINGIKNGAKAVSKALPETLKNIASKAVSAFKSIKWSSFGSSVVKLLGNGLRSAASAIPNVLKSVGSKAITAFKNIKWASVGKTVITILSNAVRGAGRLVMTALKTAGTSALNAFKSIHWVQLGGDIIRGIVSGIGGAASSLFNKLRSLASDALGAAKKALKIGSPSKLFRDEVGKQIPAGMAIGIDKGKKYVSKAMDNLNTLTMSSIPDYDMGYSSDVPSVASPSDSPYATIEVPEGTEGNRGVKNVTVNNYITVDGARDPEEYTERLVRSVRQQVRMA